MSNYQGTVKVFFKDKGYGFIESEGLGNVFFHISQLNDREEGEISVNDPVRFQIEASRKKPGTYTAKNVSRG